MKTLRLKYARRAISVARDSNGAPHVQGQSWRDVLYGLGYMHGVDRPTQLLFAEVMASGRSAQWIADRPGLVETDRFFRRAGLYRNLHREAAQLDEVVLGDMGAYCEGVNDGLRQAGRSLPMRASGFHPGAWRTESVMLVANLLNFGGLAIGQQQSERLLLELIQTGVPPERLKELFGPALDGADFDLLRQVKIPNRLSDESLDLITDLPRLAGSNAWAVSKERSSTGSPLLASDPHLEINRLPAVWYEAVLQWDGQYVMGATLPGCPTFAVARTRQLAWGVTYLKGDTSDSFVEECRRVDHAWQYRRGDAWFNFQRRTETIERKGAEPETFDVYFNAQGTLGGDPEATGPGYYLTTLWTGDFEGVGRSLITWFNLVHCQTAHDAMDWVRDCPQPTLCWMFADRAGHIGMQANGWFPKRPEHVSGLYPVPAWDEKNHWQGRLSTDSLPRIYDPPEGYIASANEDFVAAFGQPETSQLAAPRLITLPVPDYRKRRIVERLSEMNPSSIEEMQRLQYDVISLQARDLLQVFLPHLPPGEIRDRLTAWDLSYSVSSQEATLFSRLYRNVLLEIFGQPVSAGGMGERRMRYLCTRVGFSMTVATAIDRVLLQEHSQWWQGRDKGQLIRQAAARLASEIDQPWGEVNTFRFTNRFVENQAMGRALGMHIKEMPLAGCHATPFQGHLWRSGSRDTSFAPSYHFVTDLGTDESWTNLPGGPSESGLSKWYKSDIPRWSSGEYKRLSVDAD